MSAFPADVSYNAAQGTEALLLFTVVGRENIKMQSLKVVQRHLMCNTGRKEQICGQIREEIPMDVEKKQISGPLRLITFFHYPLYRKTLVCTFSRDYYKGSN